MACIICKSPKVNCLEIIKGLDGEDYKIFNCLNCDTNFTQKIKETGDIYNKVYSQDNFSSGYDKYFKIFSTIKKNDRPLEFLVKQQPLYLPIYKFLKNQKNLRILEVGCGLGYLTYALNQLGHSARGIDLSRKSIELAKQNFGDYYENSIIDKLVERPEKFDLIVATELIEHLDQPVDFIKNCYKLLADKGSVILTTPNKDYYGDKYVWNTELPPLHLSWIGTSGLKKMLSNDGLTLSIFNYLKNGVVFWENRNLLTDYFLSRKHSYLNFMPVLDNNAGRNQKPSFMKKVFVDYRAIRLLSNLFYAVYSRNSISKYVIISAVLTKN